MRYKVIIPTLSLLGLLIAPVSYALETHVPGSACNKVSNAAYTSGSVGIVNVSSTYGAFVVCPVGLVDQTTQKTGSVEARVMEYFNSTSSSASLSCTLRVYNSTGGIYSSSKQSTSTTGTGVTTLKWSSVTFPAGGFIFADCTLPKNTAAGKSQVNYFKATYN